MQLTAAPAFTPSFTPAWSEPIDSVGTDRFPLQLMQTLKLWVGVEHHAAFRLTQGQAQLLATDDALADKCPAALADAAGSFARAGGDARPASQDAGTVLLRLDTVQLRNAAWSAGSRLEWGDGVFVSGERDGHVFGLALLRTTGRGTFSADELQMLHSVASTWLSLLAKHERMLRDARQRDPSPALLGSVEQIEATLMSCIPELTKREAQVCARILRGISTPGIAIDLGVREDSVATYRKRAYRRLAIGSRFELIQLFVGTCTSGSVARH